VSGLALRGEAAAYHVQRLTGGRLENGMERTSNVDAAGAAARTESHQDEAAPSGGEEIRSGFGTVPGSELTPAVYVTVFAAFAWVMLAGWVAFARDADAELALSFALVLTVVFFALPLLVFLTAKHRARKEASPGDFLSARVETWTGTLTGAGAWLQILLIPAALALAATLIGAVNVVVH
jgi:hypothetical protein